MKIGAKYVRYIVDHDLHIHSKLSSCSKSEEQTKENILKYGIENNFKTICLTDHFWDETVDGANDWYMKQGYEHIKQSLPLPQDENVKFLFGCETDLDKYFTLGLSKENFDKFDFVIIPTTHLHMTDFTIDAEKDGSTEGRAKLWEERLNAVLDMDLPFEKVGIAHITCRLVGDHKNGEDLKIYSMLEQKVLNDIFEKAAEKKLGIELNFNMNDYNSEGKNIIYRIYNTAKKAGCKFYLGSDSHSPEAFLNAKQNFNEIIDFLDLKETDKFFIV